ncbi:hypothetical protein J4413_02525 [Candidatus Woesearchaeota archaeon]|nr:hypothetical protein [Candidatus Woesearchaeota archaeon]
MEIIADYREKRIILELSKKEIDVKSKSLISADFIINSKTKNGKEVLVGIERKTLTDFLNSIIDKRIITQLISLKENFDIPLLVIEGEQNIYKIRNFHPNSIRGMLSAIAIDLQIPTLYTKNEKDTASYIETIAKRIESKRKDISLLKKRKPLELTELQEYIIESFPGIGPTIAKNLLKKFKTVKKIVNAEEKELLEVEKLGKKKVKEIKRVLEEDYKLRT